MGSSCVVRHGVLIAKSQDQVCGGLASCGAVWCLGKSVTCAFLRLRPS